jgi:hypothetical protein
MADDSDSIAQMQQALPASVQQQLPSVAVLEQQGMSPDEAEKTFDTNVRFQYQKYTQGQASAQKSALSPVNLQSGGGFQVAQPRQVAQTQTPQPAQPAPRPQGTQPQPQNPYGMGQYTGPGPVAQPQPFTPLKAFQAPTIGPGGAQIPVPQGQAPPAQPQQSQQQVAQQPTAPQQAQQPEQDAAKKLAKMIDDIISGTDQEEQQLQAENKRFMREEQGFAQESMNIAREKERAAMGEVGALKGEQQQMRRLFSQFPTRQIVNAAARRSAPLALVMASLGGAASRLSGMAMLGAINGVAKGINRGEEENYKNALNEWKVRLDEYKELTASEKETFGILNAAYKDREDANTVAMNTALALHNDQVSDITLHSTLLKNKAELIDKLGNAYKVLNTALTGLPEGFTQDDIDFYARQQLAGDTTWKVGLSRSANSAQIIRAVEARVPTLAREAGLSPEGVATVRDLRKSIAHALTQRTNYVASANQFINNFQKQADLVLKYMGTGQGGLSPVFNRWIQAGRKQIAGDGDVNALDTAIRGLAREHQRIVTGVTSNAQLHASAQHTADELLNIDDSPSQIRDTIKVMREEAQNARDSGIQETQDLQQQLSHLGVAAQEERNYQSADDVKAAFKRGELTEDEALDILRNQFGMQ